MNSRKGPILPWLRSIDGLNTHDDAYRLAISGGVTSAQILPGSSIAIGMDVLCHISFTEGRYVCACRQVARHS